MVEIIRLTFWVKQHNLFLYLNIILTFHVEKIINTNVSKYHSKYNHYAW